MGRLIVGAWDCKCCNTKAVSGELRVCPHCGNPRGEGVKFYLPNQRVVVEEEKAETINRNPNWLCSYCDTYNSDSVSVCESCGNTSGTADIDYFKHHENLEKKASQEADSDETNFAEFYKETESFGSKVKKVLLNLFSAFKHGIENVKDFITPKMIICFSVIILVILGIVALVTPKVEKMTVEQTHWVHSVEIEEERTVDESGWSLPASARLHRTSKEIHHYDKVIDHYEKKSRQVAEKVLDHYETKTKEVSERVLDHYEDVVVGHRDLGNGYFEEITRKEPVYRTEWKTVTYQEPVYKTVYRTEYYDEPVYKEVPVYKTKYYYEIDKWFYNRTVQSSGIDKNTYWPDEKLSSKERVSNKKTSYYVKVVNEEGKYEDILVEYENWLTIEVDDVVKVKKWFWCSKIVFEE